jgi:uncharacterized lipoprotein NlpE involved in copper resistance
MKRAIALLVLTGALSIAACDNRDASSETEDETVVDATVAPAAVEVAVPAAAPSAADAPPVDSTALPPEKRSSAESVKPESETLFY